MKYATTVHNLTIEDVSTNAGSADYIKFDPEGANGGSASPTISFKVQDLGDPGRYEWWIWLRATDENGWYTYATLNGKMDAPGNKTVTINAPQSPDTQSVDLTDWGNYAFDLRVVKLGENDVAGDYQDLRSSYISIPFNMPGVTGEDGLPVPGHSVDGWSTEQTDYKYYASYYLQSARDASAMKVEFLDPKLRVKNPTTASTMPTAKNTPHPDLELYTPADGDEAGDYRGIFVPVDDYKTEYRNHQDKAMLAVNQKKSKPKSRNFNTLAPMDTTSWPSYFQKRVGYHPTVGAANLSAQILFEAMTDSTLYYCTSHGSDPAGGQIVVGGPDRLQAFRPEGYTGGYYISDHPSGVLSKMELVILADCNSNLSQPPIGNLCEALWERGAQMVVGYNEHIDADHTDMYSFYLWQGLCAGQTTTSPTLIHPALPPNPATWASVTDQFGTLGVDFALSYAAQKFKTKFPLSSFNYDNYAIYSKNGYEGRNKKIAVYKGGKWELPK